MNGEEILEHDKTKWEDSFQLHHPFDRGVLIGMEPAVMAEKVLLGRKEERENITGQSENKTKDSFTGSATIFRKVDGSLYAMVHTEWVGQDGQTDDETTSYDTKVPLTEEQLQTMRKAREAYKNQK